MTSYRVLFDVPISQSVEPGFHRTQHCSEFQPRKDSDTDVFQDPITGLLMLRPKFLVSSWYEDAQPLTAFRTEGTGWKEIKRTASGSNLVKFFTNLTAATASVSFPPLAVVAFLAQRAAANVADKVEWALETNYSLDPDEGFCVFYHTLHDELATYHNWQYYAWDNIAIHIGSTGLITVYQYTDRQDMGNPAKMKVVDSFTFADLRSTNNTPGYLMFIPVPGTGILVFHSHNPPVQLIRRGNANKDAYKGHLIPWPTRIAPDGTGRLFESSPLRIGLNQLITYNVGVVRITYPATGTFTDGAFDIGYRPSESPVDMAVLTGYNTTATAATGVLRNTTDDADWAPGTDRQARMKMTLTTSNPRRSPVVYGYTMRWPAVLETRPTTAIEPERIIRAEIVEDSQGHFDGTVTVLMQTNEQRLLAERADTTWRLDKSSDGFNWEIVTGGLARVANIQYQNSWAGPSYLVRFTLHDMRQRFHEIVRRSITKAQSAFDGVPVGTAINTLLQTSGFAGLSSVPPAVNSVTLPPVKYVGAPWQFAPRTGEDMEKMMNSLLLYLRKQGEEWRLRWDMSDQSWAIEKRLHSTSAGNTWTFTEFDDEVDIANRVLRFETLEILDPEPPEGNAFRAVGITGKTDSPTVTYSDIIYNGDSRNVVSSPDYLGRFIPVDILIHGISDKGELNKMAYRAMDALCHRRLPVRITCHQFAEGFLPNAHVIVRATDGFGNRANLFDLWLKKRTLIVEDGSGDVQSGIYELDTVWENEI